MQTATAANSKSHQTTPCSYGARLVPAGKKPLQAQPLPHDANRPGKLPRGRYRFFPRLLSSTSAVKLRRVRRAITNNPTTVCQNYSGALLLLHPQPHRLNNTAYKSNSTCGVQSPTSRTSCRDAELIEQIVIVRIGTPNATHRSPCRPKRRDRTSADAPRRHSRTFCTTSARSPGWASATTTHALGLLTDLLVRRPPECALDRSTLQLSKHPSLLVPGLSNCPRPRDVLHPSPCPSAGFIGCCPQARRSLRAVFEPWRCVIDSSAAYSSRQKKAILSLQRPIRPRTRQPPFCSIGPAGQLKGVPF